jgi:hypothetical protein
LCANSQRCYGLIGKDMDCEIRLENEDESSSEIERGLYERRRCPSQVGSMTEGPQSA